MSGIKDFSAFHVLRYFNHGLRNFETFPDVPTQRFNWEFFFVFSGSVSPQPIAGRLANAKSRNFWVLAPGQRYNWEPNSPLVERAVFHFAYVPDLLLRTLQAKEFLALTLTSDQLARVRMLISEFEEFYRNPTPLSLLFYEKVLLELSLLALHGTPYPVQQTLATMAKDRVERAIAWYREHISECPGLKEISAGTHISSSQLRRHFYEETGKSPFATLLSIRMQKAAEILSTSTLTLEQVSKSCGFASAADFCRVFKKYYKTTAHVWRRRVSRADAGANTSSEKGADTYLNDAGSSLPE